MIPFVSITATALMLLCSGNAVLHTENDQQNNVVDFMNNNFDTFIAKYNETHSEKLEASKIKRSVPIDSPFAEQVYFIDFDNGYMVVSDDYNIYEMNNNDLAFEDDIFTSKNVYYDGTSFYLDGIEFGVYDDGALLDGKDSAAISAIAFSTYASDTNEFASDDGKLSEDKISSYISSYYPDYNIVDSSYIDNYQYIYQFDTSVYLPYTSTGSYSSEGNCVINSTFSMLYNMAKKDWDRDFLYNDSYIDYSENITQDSHYYLLNLTDQEYKLNDRRGRIGYPYTGYNCLENMSQLYLRLREEAIGYGYNETKGMTFGYAENMAETVEKWYGYITDFYRTNDYNNMKDLVDSNIPCLVSSSGSLTYGNHAMAVRGYIKLEKTSGWRIFTSTDTKWLLAVDDGHSYKISEGKDKDYFYDPNRAGGATFICANKSTLDYSTC